MFVCDIHSNFETVDTAMYNMKETINLARRQREKVICFIVGYGSKGGSHKILSAAEEALTIMKEKNNIKDFIKGNHLDMFDSRYLEFKYKELIPNEEKRRKNPGAIFVIL